MHESRDHKGGGNKKRRRVVECDGCSQGKVPHCEKPNGESQSPQDRTLNMPEEILGVRRLTLNEHYDCDKDQTNERAVKNNLKRAGFTSGHFYK